MKLYTSITRNNRFRQIYNKGKCVVDPLLVVYTMKNRGQGIRVGISVSKKIGGAVERNRAKRVIRAGFVEVLKSSDYQNLDFVLVARVKTVSAKSTQIEKALRYRLKKLAENGDI